VATDVLVLLHIPLIAASVKVDVVPEHINVGPDIADGVAYTVTDVPTSAPHPVENDIEVVPWLTPVTLPLPSTVATDVVVLLHTPLPARSVRLVIDPSQTLVVPDFADGAAVTVTVLVAVDAHAPDPLVAVITLVVVVNTVVGL
jgi:hypothetical protein